LSAPIPGAIEKLVKIKASFWTCEPNQLSHGAVPFYFRKRIKRALKTFPWTFFLIFRFWLCSIWLYGKLRVGQSATVERDYLFAFEWENLWELASSFGYASDCPIIQKVSYSGLDYPP
jgi:hypothetical protein